MTANVTFSGSCTLGEAVAVQDSLQAVLRDAPAGLLIDCSAVDTVDVSFLQLLAAARQQLGASGRSFAIIMSEPLKRAVERAGLSLEATA
ncbi:STAS domain-containing protein [Fulvimarina sp. 2208YS6-2-32]|uniref:STAS domain-containing protein n=1 Tax=Fulvimarina uroteuthidis TaxID=3098149 RepID=A0ABU5HWV7_9HYPH|nr:STAS domain-containing protein [Fulvimarina sp. 2208YS6-2-32]MDY8107624.1 STAS domain-containing protein [Fulvimarina sp. 2208YS6-2-32]